MFFVKPWDRSLTDESQCGAIIAPSIFSQILTIDAP